MDIFQSPSTYGLPLCIVPKFGRGSLNINAGCLAAMATSSLVAAYGDTTDDEDSDIDIDLAFSEAFLHW